LKNVYSLIACCIVSIVLLQYRLSYSGLESKHELKITTWDALGYYMYLPGIFIYRDVTALKWLPEIDKKYGLSGGHVYQANIYKDNKYVFKYLGGVAMLETPFFLIGHLIARKFHYDADGFSAPYQYSLAFGVLIYCLLAVFLLRSILLRYFSDLTVAITLLLLMLATNIIQYVAIDSAQSHGYIFPLYVVMIYLTIKWHEKPGLFLAAMIGYVIGLASISRPTEAIMLFIPLLWGTETKESAKEKWSFVRKHKNHVYFALLFAFLGVLPQLIYWQIATGFFIYDVGSKWTFLNPFFRVLIGWQKGWFIYTPVTVFFIAGMFYLKSYPFKKSVLWFCLLNIYIVISWFDWRYGGSYSTRALSQSYPVFALPLAAYIEQVNQKKWRFFFYGLGLYLIGVNLFQIVQYNKQILHYDQMNRTYYGRIYLNPDPTPLDMSTLDTNEYLGNENRYQLKVIAHTDTSRKIQSKGSNLVLLLETSLGLDSTTVKSAEVWLKIESEIKVSRGFWDSYLTSEVETNGLRKRNSVRLFSVISKEGQTNNYAFYVRVRVEAGANKTILRIYINPKSDFEGTLEKLRVTSLFGNFESS